ncbi:hypothetical protein [Rhizobacter sp. Root1221]|uniref:hypothetical protein n=1 Tax=Rhizobacter sp. Root1221 TaxID=1736433 RepID=UPI0006FF42C7|nr:hypothetical protein [Rhizobacter sp. Root1221]KQV98010.1 hypothetical protein ASC87_22595 [Rhizobacter sp. Root1221]
MNKVDICFSPEEITSLRVHGVVLFSGRVIFDAEPPMPEARMASIEALCAGPVPEALLALWAQTAGGRLDYDLSVAMNSNIESVSWSELFWDGSNGYRDLQGWIEHEQELAEEAADEEGRVWNGKLTHLPFGGFEYLDRVYAVVKPGAEHGSIVAWKHGLPPAWTHALHEDDASTVASDLRGAFAALHLNEDPLAPVSDHFSGQSLLEYLHDRCEGHGLERSLMEKLVAFYRVAVVDWRAPLATGTLGQQPSVARAALRHAIATDDARLVAQLAAAGVSFHGPQQGSALATDVAICKGAFAAAIALVHAGAPVAREALTNIDSPIPPELTSALLAHGAAPEVTAVVKCAACGAAQSAQLIANACAQTGLDLPAAFASECDATLIELKATLLKVRRGKLGHYLGPEGLSARIEHLQRFKLV